LVVLVKPSVIAAAGFIAISISVTSAGLANSTDATAAAVGHPASSEAHPPIGTVTLVSPRSGAVTAQVTLRGFTEQVIVPRSGTAAYVISNVGQDLVAYKITPGSSVRVHRIGRVNVAGTLSISPDGRTIYVARPEFPAGHPPFAKIVPASTSTGRSGRPFDVRNLSPNISSISEDPNQKIMYVAADFPAQVEAIRIPSGRVIGRPLDVSLKRDRTSSVDAMAYSRSGGLLYVLSNGSQWYSRLAVINTRTDREIGSARIPGVVWYRNPADLAVTPDGNLAYVVSTDEGTGPSVSFVTVLNVKAKVTTVRTLSFDYAAAVAEAPSGRAAYVAAADYAGSETDQLIAIPTATSLPSNPVTVGEDGPVDVIISPDSATAYVEEANDEVYPLNLTTGVVGSAIVVGPQPGVFLGTGGMAFTSNGRILYVLGTPTE
jgi:DNA-binding beta-propeller fold protein YncE